MKSLADIGSQFYTWETGICICIENSPRCSNVQNSLVFFVVVCFGCVFNTGYFDANVSVQKTHNDPILKMHISV